MTLVLATDLFRAMPFTAGCESEKVSLIIKERFGNSNATA
jgi:hypothetical protein